MRGIRAAVPGPRGQRHRPRHRELRARFGYGVVRDFTGHGIGTAFHSGLVIPHYDAAPAYATVIEAGMTFTVEPMLNLGTHEWEMWDDGVDGRDQGPPPFGTVRAHHPRHGPRSRDPHPGRRSMSTARPLGIDVGGSGIKGAPVDLDKGEFAQDRFKIETPAESTPEAVCDVIAEIVDRFDEVHDGSPIGVTDPGCRAARRRQDRREHRQVVDRLRDREAARGPPPARRRRRQRRRRRRGRRAVLRGGQGAGRPRHPHHPRHRHRHRRHQPRRPRAQLRARAPRDRRCRRRDGDRELGQDPRGPELRGVGAATAALLPPPRGPHVARPDRRRRRGVAQGATSSCRCSTCAPRSCPPRSRTPPASSAPPCWRRRPSRSAGGTWTERRRVPAGHSRRGTPSARRRRGRGCGCPASPSWPACPR